MLVHSLLGTGRRADRPEAQSLDSTGANQWSMWEREMLLRLMHRSLSIVDRKGLAIWVRDELGQALPNVALVCVAGDAAGHRASVEVLALVENDVVQPCPACRDRLISAVLLERWRVAPPMVPSLCDAEDVIDGGCECAAASVLRSSRSVMVQCMRDERAGEDAMYLLFGADDAWDARQTAMFAMLMPQIDVACRRMWRSGARMEEAKASVEACLKEFREEAMISSREQEILGWVRAGKTNNEIGQILNISTFTVKNHLQRIYRKIDVINRAQAVGKFEEFARGR